MSGLFYTDRIIKIDQRMYNVQYAGNNRNTISILSVAATAQHHSTYSKNEGQNSQAFKVQKINDKRLTFQHVSRVTFLKQIGNFVDTVNSLVRRCGN